MKKSHIGKNPFIGVTCACFIFSGVFSVLAFLDRDSGIQTTQDNQRPQPRQLPAASQKPSIASATIEKPKIQPAVISTAVENSHTPEAVEENAVPAQDYADLMSEGVKEQFRQVATHYENTMRFPAYSKPLNNNDWTLLNPHPFVPQPTPIITDNGDTSDTTVSIVLSSYLVSRNEDLPVAVLLSGKASARVVTVFFTNNNVKTTLKKSTSGNAGEQLFTGVISKDLIQQVSTGEQRITAQISLTSGKTATTSAGIKIYHDEATLKGLSDAYVDHSDLVIPAHFTTSKAGYYQITGNLFDLETGTPISHINSRFNLSEQSSSGLLKVHSAILRAKGFSGPYLIKDITVTRKSSQPGDPEGYGSSLKDHYVIAGFPLSSYSDAPYQNPQNQQRLEFLQKMAGDI